MGACFETNINRLWTTSPLLHRPGRPFARPRSVRRPRRARRRPWSCGRSRRCCDAGRPTAPRRGPPAIGALLPIGFWGRVPLLKSRSEKSWYPYSTLSAGAPWRSSFLARSAKTARPKWVPVSRVTPPQERNHTKILGWFFRGTPWSLSAVSSMFFSVM